MNKQLCYRWFCLLSIVFFLNTCSSSTHLTNTPTALPSPTPTPIALTILTVTVRLPTPVPTTMPTFTPTPEGQLALVTYVIDGDTVEAEIDGQAYRVRYIGVDCPEPDQPYGQQATATNKTLIDGQPVYLVKDVSETDHYDRLLRYVFLSDGTFVNEEMVRLGYAWASAYPPDVKYEDHFLKIQAQAQQDQVGLWQPTPTPEPPTVTPTSALIPISPTAIPPTPIPTQTPPAAVCGCSYNQYNCKDFSTHAEAQACYDYCVSIGRGDIHKLDRDKDGIACETLP